MYEDTALPCPYGHHICRDTGVTPMSWTLSALKLAKVLFNLKGGQDDRAHFICGVDAEIPIN